MWYPCVRSSINSQGVATADSDGPTPKRKREGWLLSITANSDTCDYVVVDSFSEKPTFASDESTG